MGDFRMVVGGQRHKGGGGVVRPTTPNRGFSDLILFGKSAVIISAIHRVRIRTGAIAIRAITHREFPRFQISPTHCVLPRDKIVEHCEIKLTARIVVVAFTHTQVTPASHARSFTYAAALFFRTHTYATQKRGNANAPTVRALQ